MTQYRDSVNKQIEDEIAGVNKKLLVRRQSQEVLSSGMTRHFLRTLLAHVKGEMNKKDFSEYPAFDGAAAAEEFGKYAKVSTCRKEI